MPRRKRIIEDVTDDGLTVSKPPKWAAGVPGVIHALQHAEREMGAWRGSKTLRRINQEDGFDCTSCAWPDPPHRHTVEF